MRTSGPDRVTGSSYRAGDTCHLDVADRFGNMVSATPSGGWLQSSPVIPGLGFCLGTRAQMFTLTPGLPATLAPGKRPRTTLSPSLALRDREPYLAFGTPGGDQQDQWTLLFFLNHVLAGMNLQQAIDFPSFHSAHMPSSFYPRQAQPRVLDIESRAGTDVIEDLRRRGHLVNVRPAWSLGRVSAVARRNGILYAAANPRGMQGYAAGRLLAVCVAVRGRVQRVPARMPLLQQSRHPLGQEVAQRRGVFQDGPSAGRGVLQQFKPLPRQRRHLLVDERREAAWLEHGRIQAHVIHPVARGPGAPHPVIALEQLDRPGDGAPAGQQRLGQIGDRPLRRIAHRQVSDEPSRHRRDAVLPGVEPPSPVGEPHRRVISHVPDLT